MLFDTDYTAAIKKYFSLRGPTRKRAKTMCKGTGHVWNDVTRDTEIWPYKFLVRRQCERCGKKSSAKGIVGVGSARRKITQ